MVLAPGFLRPREPAACGHRCAADAALSRFRGPGHSDDGSAQCAASLRDHRLLAAAIQHRPDRHDLGAAAVAPEPAFCRAGDSCDRGRRGHAAIAGSCGPEPPRQPREPIADFPRCRDARFCPQGHPRHDREFRAATAYRGRRDRRIGIAVGRVVALLRQPPDRIAARDGRRRHGHRAGAGNDPCPQQGRHPRTVNAEVART